jgi:hypothetical protein
MCYHGFVDEERIQCIVLMQLFYCWPLHFVIKIGVDQTW